MENMLKELVCVSKALTTTRITGSVSVSKTPCYLFDIFVCPTTATSICEAKIYDGHNTAGELKLDFESIYAQVCSHMSVPMRFNKGIYCDLTVNVKSITLHYLSFPE